MFLPLMVVVLSLIDLETVFSFPWMICCCQVIECCFQSYPTLCHMVDFDCYMAENVSSFYNVGMNAIKVEFNKELAENNVQEYHFIFKDFQITQLQNEDSTRQFCNAFRSLDATGLFLILHKNVKFDGPQNLHCLIFTLLNNHITMPIVSGM